MSMHETLEHTEHISHAGGHGHGDQGGGVQLGTFIGITMAMLGVLLAFCAAKVGGERTELVHSLVEQSNAHAQYHAQDVKHRVAVIALQQVHATALSKSGGDSLNKADVAAMARTCERYLTESDLAKTWAHSFDTAVVTHIEASEKYETAQLCSEIGIVLASVALLIKKRVPWLFALALGLAAIGIVGQTYVHTGHVIEETEHKIHTAEHAYAEARKAGKTTNDEAELIASVYAWAGVPPKPAAAPGAPAHGEAHGEAPAEPAHH